MFSLLGYRMTRPSNVGGYNRVTVGKNPDQWKTNEAAKNDVRVDTILLHREMTTHKDVDKEGMRIPT